MPSSPKIPKEIILKHALQLIIRDGYSTLNIKLLAKEIGCSTQPISWHFGNMEGLRKELSEYALQYAYAKMYSQHGNALEAFWKVGKAFVDIAVKEPYLFRFLYLEGNCECPWGNIDFMSQDMKDYELVKRLSSFLDISEQAAGRYFRNTIIYTHGIATLVATDILNATEEEMLDLIYSAVVSFLIQEKVPMEKIPEYETLNRL